MICDALPRARFAFLPTPLEEVARLSRTLGGPRLFFKRDDLSGLSVGGNKSRLYEFAMGDVLHEDCDAVIASASVQSNKMREAAAAANKLGLKCVLLPGGGTGEEEVQGNLLLFHLLGAEVHFLPPGEDSGDALFRHFEAHAERLRQQGHKPYLLDRRLTYGAMATAAYVDMAEELVGQLESLGQVPDYVYITCGAGMTTAGLALGLKHLGHSARVVGVSAGAKAEAVVPDMLDYATRAGEAIGIPTRLEPADFDILDSYVGGGYGELTEGCLEALTLVARTESVLLDPVYTGKTMAALIDQVRQGRLTHEHTAVFVHTGGTPALYAYHEALARAFVPKG